MLKLNNNNSKLGLNKLDLMSHKSDTPSHTQIICLVHKGSGVSVACTYSLCMPVFNDSVAYVLILAKTFFKTKF